MADEEYETVTEFECAFCGGQCQAVRKVGEADASGIIHLAPECQRFMDLDVIDFAIENRRRHQQRAWRASVGLPPAEEN